MEGLKESKQAVAGEALTAMSGFAPPMLLGSGCAWPIGCPSATSTRDTNVPGPQLPLYVAGRRMLKPSLRPLAGSIRIGVAIFSYDGQVNFGVTGDYDTTEDLPVLCEGIETE